jgi:hypothetical protein
VGYVCNFHNTAHSKQSPIGRKFALSPCLWYWGKWSLPTTLPPTTTPAPRSAGRDRTDQSLTRIAQSGQVNDPSTGRHFLLNYANCICYPFLFTPVECTYVPTSNKNIQWYTNLQKWIYFSAYSTWHVHTYMVISLAHSKMKNWVSKFKKAKAALKWFRVIWLKIERTRILRSGM